MPGNTQEGKNMKYQIREHKNGKRSYCGTPVDADGYMHIMRHTEGSKQKMETGLPISPAKDRKLVQAMLDRNTNPEIMGAKTVYLMAPDEYEAYGRVCKRAMVSRSTPAGDAFKGLL